MQKSKFKKGMTALAAILCILAVLCATALTLVYLLARRSIDYGADELLFASAENGNAIRLYADSDPYDTEYTPIEIETVYPGEGQMEWVEYKDIPDRVIQSFLAMEDRAFFTHKGFSPLRTARAALNYILGSRGGSFGGSTVTQQVVKNISGDSDYTVKRKLCEILRAYHMERLHSKEEILEVYLNILPMGESTVGVGLAAERYFGKTLDALSYEEIATLVGIANAPGRYNPHENPEACREKRNRVLFAMRTCGVIGEKEYRTLCESPLRVCAPQERECVSSWFCETVLSELREDLMAQRGISAAVADALLAKGGLSVYTTVDPEVQRVLEQAFSDMNRLPKECASGLEGAMVVVDAENGYLRGIVGRVGKKQGSRLLNHALVPHTPGSALKPLALYAPLIDAGRITPATVMDDVPLSFTESGGSLREYPRNYPAVYSGLITVRDALRLSKNTVAIRLYEMLGAESIYHLLSHKLGISTLARTAYAENGARLSDLAAAPLALGQLSYGVTLRALTEAYGVFPSEGVYRKGKSYLRVLDGEGEVFLEKKNEETRVFSREGARLMNQLLCEVVESGTAKSITLKTVVDTAGKTGTSGEDRDRMFIGYTPYYVAGIWMGYESGERAVGGIAPTHLAVWDRVMRTLHEGRLRGESDGALRGFSTEGLVRCRYCKDSGAVCSGFCKMDLRGEREDSFYFLKGSRPTGLCHTHIPVYYDLARECPATSETPLCDLTIVSMLRIGKREFPKPVYIGDQRFVYTPPAGEGDLPLFPIRERKRYA